MRIKVGIMGSADDTLRKSEEEEVRAKCEALGHALAARGCVVMTGATTGLPHIVGGAAQAAGAPHMGVSPAPDEREHTERFGLPVEGSDVLIYTGFGLKGRNVVLVRSCDVIVVVRGSMGALNEFTIAHDEGRVVGCLRGTGGAADEIERLVLALPKSTRAQVFHDDDPARLLDTCLDALDKR